MGFILCIPLHLSVNLPEQLRACSTDLVDSFEVRLCDPRDVPYLSYTTRAVAHRQRRKARTNPIRLIPIPRLPPRVSPTMPAAPSPPLRSRS